MIIHADVETRSPVDLKKQGAYVYFEHPATEVLMCAYRINQNELQLWDRSRYFCPSNLEKAILKGATIVAHNAQFEMLAFEWLAKHRRWPWAQVDQFIDTAAQAAALGLPRALENLGPALGLKIQKDKEGKRLINKFCKPRRGGGWNEPEDHPADWELFKLYCKGDVLTEEAAEKRMIPLSSDEQGFWLLSELINRRGVRVDRRSIRAALMLAEKAKGAFDAEMGHVTGGAVQRCSEVAALARWVNDQGVELDSLAKADIIEALDYELPDPVRRALELRQAAAKTSVSKLRTMLARSSPDGRVRGAFIYHAASTGRTQSVGVNFNNMPRPRQIFADAHLRTDLLFDTIRMCQPELLELMYGPELGNPLHLLADAIRGFIWAAPRCELVAADYTGIEGAVIAWLADEAWKLEAMRGINADPSRPDMYRQTAAGIMGMTTDEIDKKHPLRQSVGKVSELAFGFGGGVMAFASMAKNYSVELEPLYGPVWDRAEDWVRQKATVRYERLSKRKDRSTQVLTRPAWLAAEAIKLGWRAANPAIVESWHDLEAAARTAVRNPGLVTTAAKVRYRMAFGFLFACLPSGRCLAYAHPRLRDQVWARRLVEDTWCDPEVMDRADAEKGEMLGRVRIEGETSPKVTALGVNSVTRKFERFALYGGLAAENNTQAVARDLLKNGMERAEAAGYPVVLTVYDEIVTEVQRGYGDVAEFEQIICELPPWATGIPLAAGGYRAKRYRKG